MKAPTWDWEGVFACPECGEEFRFMREDNVFPEGTVLQVYHDHTEDPAGVWRGAAYRTWKGRRRPSIVKDAEAQRKAAYKSGVERRRVEKASTA